MTEEVGPKFEDDNRVFVAVTAIKHGAGEVDEDGKPVFVYVEPGEKVIAHDFPSEEVLNNLIASGSVAEYKDVLVVEDTAKIEALTTENEELKARLAAFEAQQVQADTQQQTLPQP